jgi:DNA repair photolyase
MTAPIVPGLNDHEIPSILERAAAAGAVTAGWTMLRLSPPVDQLFDHWLAESYPERRNRVLHRIRECRSGSLSDPRFGTRMSGEGVYAKQIAELFWTATRRHGLDGDIPPLSVGSFRVPPQSGDQLQLC